MLGPGPNSSSRKNNVLYTDYRLESLVHGAKTRRPKSKNEKAEILKMGVFRANLS